MHANKITHTQNIIAICCLKGFVSFASSVMFASLALILNSTFHVNKEHAAAMTGIYLALSYGLPLFAGYLGGRFFDLKKLYITGMLLQALGYFLFGRAHQAIAINCAMSFILMGNFVNSVSILEFIAYATERAPETRRRIMLFNYASMNLGFIVGGLFSGWFSLIGHFEWLFFVLPIAPLLCAWISHQWVPYRSNLIRAVRSQYFGIGLIFTLIISAVFFIFLFVQQSQNYLLVGVSIGLLSALIYTYCRASRQEIFKLIIFSFYLILWILYWAIYLLMPIMLMYFMRDWVSLNWHGMILQPQWLESFDPILIVFLTPLLAWVFKKRKVTHSREFTSPVFFSIAMLCTAIAAAAMMSATISEVAGAKSSVGVMLFFIGLLAIGELFIVADGYTLPAKLAPDSCRSLLNGVWVASMSVSSLLASSITHHFFQQSEKVKLHSYHTIFSGILTTSCIAILAIVLFVAISKIFVRRKY